MNLLQSLVARPPMRSQSGGMSLDDFVDAWRIGAFPMGLNQTMQGNREEIETSFGGYAVGGYMGNSVIFACMATRMMLFSQARFQFQQMRAGQPGDLFGTPDLALLENPEPGKVTADLLARAMTDADLAGTNFYVRRPDRLKRLRPDWVGIILGSNSETNPLLDPNDVDAEMIGIVYWPGGYGSGSEPMSFTRDEYSFYAPYTDPLAHYRGMSWLTPVIREVMADTSATSHKLRFFEHAATPNLLVKTPVADPAKFREWISVFEQDHKGVANAYKTMYVGAGMDATVIGANLQQLDFKVTQGAGETRIAAAARVHPTVVGLSEGLAGASLNAGNFRATVRITADTALRPNWANLAASLQTIIPPPSGSRLWYDERSVPFLAEDIKDQAEVQSMQASSIRTLSDGGFEPDNVVDAIVSGDLRRLTHTGAYSVQLQAPGTTPPAATATRTFWAASGAMNGREVQRGERLDASDPVVRAFPSLFEAAEVIEGTAVEVRSGVRCLGCKRFLAELATSPYKLRCRDCKTVTVG